VNDWEELPCHQQGGSFRLISSASQRSTRSLQRRAGLSRRCVRTWTASIGRRKLLVRLTLSYHQLGEHRRELTAGAPPAGLPSGQPPRPGNARAPSDVRRNRAASTRSWHYRAMGGSMRARR
jgi:hypothetical protein